MKKLSLMIPLLLLLYSCAEDLSFTFPSGDGVIIDGEYKEIYLGKFNVMARFHNSDNNEYVSVEDGSVIFTVFNKEGNRAANAVVKGLPGIPNETFTADQHGSFTVSKDLLPKNESHSGATESVTYGGETETSANNTYVPCKVEVRLVLASAPLLVNNGNGSMSVSINVERKVSDARGWETAPSYLGLPSVNELYIYEVEKDSGTGLVNLVDYANRNPSGITNITLSNQIISSTVSATIQRHVAQTYLKGDSGLNGSSTATPIWDGETHYITAQFKRYYGEEPILNGVIEMAPIQLIPLLDTVTTKQDAEEHSVYPGYYVFNKLDFRFLTAATDYYDVANSLPYVNYDLLFNQNFIEDSAKAVANTFDYYYIPDIMPETTAQQTETLTSYLSIRPGGNESINNSNYPAASISDNSYYLTSCFVGSYVTLTSSTWLFKTYALGNIYRKSEITNQAGAPDYDYYISRGTDLSKSLYIGLSIVP